MTEYNPFPKNAVRLQTMNYCLESILFNFNLLSKSIKREKPYCIDGNIIMELNMNPYVYSDDGKKYYQRPLCWNLEDKQQLIQSIYNGVDIGGIVCRKHNIDDLEKLCKSGETELAFYDIVDGKQRLNTIKEFVNNEFSDFAGMYFKDFDNRSRLEFYRSQLLKYSEMVGNDVQTIEQFLKMNNFGVPQSKEHLENVGEILESIGCLS